MVIHLDPVATNDERVDVLRRWISHDVVNIDSRLSIHDLRIVPGEHKTNVIFDCFSPYTVPIDEETLKRTITKRVVKEFPQYNCVIKIDRG